jgi:hypothetical protein
MLPKDLEKLLMKKKDSGKDMSEDKVNAKLEVLKELIEAAQAEMGHRFKNGMDEMQKVSVMAPDKESLQEGLEKAQEVVESPMMEKMEEMASQDDMDKDKEEGEPEEHKMEVMGEEKEEEEKPKEPKRRKLFSMEDDEDEE